jgi:hypothetical protein
MLRLKHGLIFTFEAEVILAVKMHPVRRLIVAPMAEINLHPKPL